jgi:hypothetical protein
MIKRLILWLTRRDHFCCFHYKGEVTLTRHCSNGNPSGQANYWAYQCCVCGKAEHHEVDYSW